MGWEVRRKGEKESLLSHIPHLVLSKLTGGSATYSTVFDKALILKQFVVRCFWYSGVKVFDGVVVG